MASLVLTVSQSAANQNLTSLGAADWAQWASSSLTPDNTKSGGGSTISAAIYSAGSATTYSGDPRTISWTDGTPTASSSSTSGTFNFNGGDGVGFEIQYPADTSTREARLFLGYYRCAAKVTAIISDASTGNQVDSTTLTLPTDFQDGLAIVTYAAGSSGQNMKIRLEVLLGTDAGRNVAMQAASVKVTGGGSKAGWATGATRIIGGAF